MSLLSDQNMTTIFAAAWIIAKGSMYSIDRRSTGTGTIAELATKRD